MLLSLTSPPGAKCSKSLSADMPFSFAFSVKMQQCNVRRTGEWRNLRLFVAVVVIGNNKDIHDCRRQRRPLDFPSGPWVYPPPQNNPQVPPLSLGFF